MAGVVKVRRNAAALADPAVMAVEEDAPEASGVVAPDGCEVSLPAEYLARALRAVSLAASTDEARPHVCAVLLELQGGILRAVATDGHRLAVWEFEGVEVAGAKDARLVVPLASVEAMIVRLQRGRYGVVIDLWTRAVTIVGEVIHDGVGARFAAHPDTAPDFPPWRYVVENRECGTADRTASHVAMNAAYLGDIVTMFRVGAPKVARKRGEPADVLALRIEPGADPLELVEVTSRNLKNRRALVGELTVWQAPMNVE